MTTFKEAGKIVDELSEQGISNQVINYQDGSMADIIRMLQIK